MRPILIALPLLALPLLALAACSQGTTEAAPPPADAPPVVLAVVLAGVDLNQPLRALGTEPFWGVDITPATLTYSGLDRPEQRASNPGPVIQGAIAVYATATEGGTTLVVTLIATECSDGMSDRVYPLTARVELGEETLNGCAASVAFLKSQPPA